MAPYRSDNPLQKDLKVLRNPIVTRRTSSSPSIHSLTATVSPPVPTSRGVGNSQPVSGNGNVPSEQSVEQKRLLIRKQLVILLHAIVCRRRDLMSAAGRGDSPPQACNVPFCGLMKTVLLHLNSCKAGRTCSYTHCASSRQIMIHWKYCVKSTCPVCVSLRTVVPTSLLQIFPNPLCTAEVLQRSAREQEQRNAGDQDQAVPELLESEE